MTESTPNQAILKGSKTLAQVRMAFIMLTLFVLVLLSLLLRLVFFLFPRHLFLRFNVRFIIYPFSKLLMWDCGSEAGSGRKNAFFSAPRRKQPPEGF